MPVFFRELKRNKLLVIIWSAASAGMLAVSLLIYPLMVSSLQSLAEMGDAFSAMGLSAQSFLDYTGYCASEISSVIGIGGAIFAALIGVNALSREEKEHTAEFLLTHPVSRGRVVLEKLLAVVAACLVLNVASAALGAASSAVIGEKADAGVIALTFLAHYIMHVEVASICFLLGSFLSRGAIAAGLGTAFGAYVLYIVANVTEKTRFLKYVTPFGYAEGSDIAARGGIHAGYLAVGLAITAACIIAAFIIYRKKDIKN